MVATLVKFWKMRVRRAGTSKIALAPDVLKDIFQGESESLPSAYMPKRPTDSTGGVGSVRPADKPQTSTGLITWEIRVRGLQIPRESGPTAKGREQAATGAAPRQSGRALLRFTQKALFPSSR